MKFRLWPRTRLGVMCVSENLVEPARVLQPDANAHKRRRHTVMSSGKTSLLNP